MKGGVERGLPLLAAVFLLVSAGAVVAAPERDQQSGTLSFEADVPAEYEFTPPSESGTATVDGEEFDSVQAAVEAAEPGDTVVLRGRFDERVVLNTSNLTLTSAPGSLAHINGTGEGDVLTLNGDNATLDRVWIANSGYETRDNDAAVWVNSTNARITDSRVTEMTFGIWIDGVDDAVIANNTIVGRERVQTLSYRGNGIQLWKTVGTHVEGNRITDVRDGIYYSWADDVLTRDNRMWDLRYGVHYMYSDDDTLVDNVAFHNDVGYALMVSKRLTVVDNVAFENEGSSGHGLLLKDIDDTVVRDNALVGNGKGLYVYNSLNNTLIDNLVLENDVGVHLTAGSVGERVHGNSFVRNDQPLVVVTGDQLAWNGTDSGNYWSNAQTIDLDKDGVSEVRYQPAGIVEFLVQQHPQAVVFVQSPAFDAIRLAESSFPVLESPGVVDHYPLVEPPHDDWRRFYERGRSPGPDSRRTKRDAMNRTDARSETR